jgi:hypothetical protein
MADPTYFTAQILDRTVSVVKNDVRNLRNPDLNSFYPPIERISREELDSRYAVSRDFRDLSGLASISQTEFANQLSDSGGLPLFLQVLSSVGIEAEYTQDLVETSSEARVPALGFRTTFTETKQSQGATLSIAEIRSSLREVPGVADKLTNQGPIKHLLEDAPTAVAIEDSDIQDRVALIHSYVRQWLR